MKSTTTIQNLAVHKRTGNDLILRYDNEEVSVDLFMKISESVERGTSSSTRTLGRAVESLHLVAHIVGLEGVAHGGVHHTHSELTVGPLAHVGQGVNLETGQRGHAERQQATNNYWVLSVMQNTVQSGERSSRGQKEVKKRSRRGQEEVKERSKRGQAEVKKRSSRGQAKVHRRKENEDSR